MYGTKVEAGFDCGALTTTIFFNKALAIYYGLPLR